MVVEVCKREERLWGEIFRMGILVGTYRTEGNPKCAR